jgi:hypothetical protein
LPQHRDLRGIRMPAPRPAGCALAPGGVAELLQIRRIAG